MIALSQVPPPPEPPEFTSGPPSGPEQNEGSIGSAFEKWSQTPLGQYLIAWEQAELDRIVVDLFGYNAVQIGLCGLPALRASRMQTRVVLTKSLPIITDLSETISVALVGELADLPLASESVDLLVLPHLLETCDEPHALLREVERVLRPEGKFIVTGCNPISLWGFGVGNRPPKKQWIALPRLRDWLKLLSFDSELSLYGCFKPPFTDSVWLDRLNFLEQAGDRWWPVCGAVYLHCAVKKVHGMRLVGTVWKKHTLTIAPRPAIANRDTNVVVDSTFRGK